jgi:hypothetical protein
MSCRKDSISGKSIETATISLNGYLGTKQSWKLKACYTFDYVGQSTNSIYILLYIDIQRQTSRGITV